MDAEAIQLLQRIAVACERMADVLAPPEEKREKHMAKLSTAAYTREERNRQELRATFGITKPKPARRIAP